LAVLRWQGDPKILCGLVMPLQINKFQSPGNSPDFGPSNAFLLSVRRLAMNGMRSLNRAPETQLQFSGKQSKSSILEVDLWMPSEVPAISPFVDRLMRLIETSQCVLGERFGMELALREALDNAVVHGNREDPKTKVHIRCRCEPGNEISIIVTDQGKGFDFAKFVGNGATLNSASEHGRGIQLMKAYMDDVHFERGGSEVQMRKLSRTMPRH
jgi:serine/threonine-protein kinase RsbW